MEVTIALGHFCDTHGPCVMFCTDRVKEISEELHIDEVVCNACESIQLDTVYACQDEDWYYVSTRTALDDNRAVVLKDAVLRSLSIEVVQEESVPVGTMYFGDNKRGHIISHVFDIKDSFARGFKRKYCIVVLGQDQISLLQHYDFIETNLKKLSSSIQQKACNVNTAEQSVHSQREVRQKEGYKPNQRSLAILTGEPNIFAHLHMWFVYLLRSEIYRSIPHEVLDCPVKVSASKELREFYNSVPKDVFRTLLYCTVTGIKTKYYDARIKRILNQLLPLNFSSPPDGSNLCSLSHENEVQFTGCLPPKLPTLVCQIDQAVSNEAMLESALTHHLSSLILRWLNIACVVNWTPKVTKDLLNTLEIRKCDMPLLMYWVSQSNGCVESCKIDWFEKL